MLLPALLLLLAAPSLAADLPLGALRLPPGFKIEVYAEARGARELAAAPGGVVFVGTRRGEVYALVPGKDRRRAAKVVTVASGLNEPNGVAFKDGALYVAEISRVLRYDGILARLESPPEPAIVTDALPGDEHHGWKFIRFGPEGLLYIPVGAPCNVCENGDPYASIGRLKPDGTLEVFARGVRNTVGFDWHPETKELWFTDNGRDRMGDDVPGDELNRAPKPGLHFGFPYCHAGDVKDPVYDKYPCSSFAPPARALDPHVAALGMRFYRGTMFPPEYKGRVFIAEHGSWNRSSKVGYRVMTVEVKAGKAGAYAPFLEGFLRGDRAWGRPVDVEPLDDGSLLVSDDKAGAVYRVTYSK